MQTSKRTLVFTVLTLIVWSVTATAYMAYYQIQYRQLEDTLQTMKNLILKVNVLINYGNGTKEWHNGTLVPVGASVFNATVEVAEVYYTWSGEYMLINSINGLREAQDVYWIWWIWDTSTSQWKFGPEAANKYVLKDGDTIGWNYQNWASTTPPS